MLLLVLAVWASFFTAGGAVGALPNAEHDESVSGSDSDSSGPPTLRHAGPATQLPFGSTVSPGELARGPRNAQVADEPPTTESSEPCRSDAAAARGPRRSRPSLNASAGPAVVEPVPPASNPRPRLVHDMRVFNGALREQLAQLTPLPDVEALPPFEQHEEETAEWRRGLEELAAERELATRERERSQRRLLNPRAQAGTPAPSPMNSPPRRRSKILPNGHSDVQPRSRILPPLQRPLHPARLLGISLGA